MKFQVFHEWIDDNPYNIENYGYKLTDTLHLYDRKYVRGYNIMKGIEQANNINNTIGCLLMWVKSTHAPFMPWIPIPCDYPYKVGHVICEKQVATITGNSTSIFHMAMRTCPIFWTLILQYCYRVHSSNMLELHKRNYSRLTHFPFGLDTRIDETEHNQAKLFRFLQEKTPTILKIAGTCAVLEPPNVLHSSWQRKVDCMIHEKAYMFLLTCRGRYRTFGVILLGCELCSIQPSMNAFVEMQLRISQYLAKSNDDTKHHGIAASTDFGQ